jgi:hypothetical protein
MQQSLTNVLLLRVPSDDRNDQGRSIPNAAPWKHRRGVYELARQVSRNAALLTIDRCTKLHAAFKMCRPDGLPASPGRPRVRDLKIPQRSLAWYR